MPFDMPASLLSAWQQPSAPIARSANTYDESSSGTSSLALHPSAPIAGLNLLQNGTGFTFATTSAVAANQPLAPKATSSFEFTMAKMQTTLEEMNRRIEALEQREYLPIFEEDILTEPTLPSALTGITDLKIAINVLSRDETGSDWIAALNYISEGVSERLEIGRDLAAEALVSSDPAIRASGAFALAATADAKTSSTLKTMLEGETNKSVRAAIKSALRVVPS